MGYGERRVGRRRVQLVGYEALQRVRGMAHLFLFALELPDTPKHPHLLLSKNSLAFSLSLIVNIHQRAGRE